MSPEDTAYVDRLRHDWQTAARHRTALANALYDLYAAYVRESVMDGKTIRQLEAKTAHDGDLWAKREAARDVLRIEGRLP